MAVTELVLPALKSSPEDLEAFKKAWPTLSNFFESRPEVLNGFYGWVVEENGADVRGDWRFVLVLEWDKYSSFTTFQSSPDILVFRDHIKPHLTAPAKPQLYETDSGPVPCASAPVTEIFQLKVRDSDVQAADRAWGKFVAVVERCVGKGKGEGLVGGAIGGKSLNLEAEVWVGLLGWASLEACEGVRRKDEMKSALKKLGESGEVSVSVVELKPLGTEMV